MNGLRDAMVKMCLEIYPGTFYFLLSLPGVEQVSAAIIISEMGDNLESRFTFQATGLHLLGIQNSNHTPEDHYNHHYLQAIF